LLGHFHTDDEFVKRVSHSGCPELQPAIHYRMSDGVLEGNPFRRYGLGSLVFIVSNTWLSINQCNVNHDLLLLKVSAISYNPEFLANESWI